MQPPRSSSTSPNQSKSDLIREWILKFALNAGQALDSTTVGVYTALWCESFDELPANVLEAAFRKAIGTCRFWPVKIADILQQVEHAKESATCEAADRSWEYVLDLRRRFWNPDMPGGFSRGMPALSPRIDRAARAAGVFRDHESIEALHVWAKKKFVESFTRWDEAGESQNLLPDGEIKDLLEELAQTKLLPAPSLGWNEGRARGEAYRSQLATQGLPNLTPEERLRVADELAAAARKLLDQPRETVIVVTDEGRTALGRQAEMLKRSFPMRPEAFEKHPELRKIYERYGLEIPGLPSALETAGNENGGASV